MKRLALSLAILSLLLISCKGRQVSEPIPTDTPTSTPTTAPQPSPTETPTETPAPSDTPAPSATPKPTSTLAGALPAPAVPTVSAPEATVMPTTPAQPAVPAPTVPSQPPPPAPVPAPTGDIDALIQGLLGGSDGERMAAVEGLIAMGPAGQQAIPQLVQALDNQDPAVLTAIFEVLGAQPPELIVPQLAQALSGGDPQVINAIAQQLGSLGPQAMPAVEPLIQAMANANEQTAAALAQALASITGQNFGIDAAAWQQWWAEQQASLPDGGPLDFETPTKVDRHVSIDGGYLATISIEITGGVGPFTVQHDMDVGIVATRIVSIEFQSSGCGLIVHGIRVESADGQSVSHDYALEPPWCD